MSVMIGHASKDERGKYSGGATGDQNGTEVCTRTWYNRPWNVILRAKDYSMADRIALAMESACKNDRIGYDQHQRNGALLASRKVGYDPALITDYCETDCSALVSLCCFCAGIAESVLYVDGNSATTSNLRARLRKTGLFEELTDSKHLTTDAWLRRGDILLLEGHHVAVALTDGACSTVAAAPPTTTQEVYTMKTLRKGSKGTQVRVLQYLLNWNGCDCGHVDADFGSKTEAALKRYQKDHGLAVDGICGQKTWKELLA